MLLQIKDFSWTSKRRVTSTLRGLVHSEGGQNECVHLREGSQCMCWSWLQSMLT